MIFDLSHENIVSNISMKINLISHFIQMIDRIHLTYTFNQNSSLTNRKKERRRRRRKDSCSYWYIELDATVSNMSNTYLYRDGNTVWSTSRISSLSLSFILGNKKKKKKKTKAIDKRNNSYMLRLLSFSMFHRDHFLSFVCAPIVRQYLSLSNKRHRSSPTVIVLLFNSYRPMIIVMFSTCLKK
jgi:hypothetical protein